jgi:hypothetical protein
VAPQPQCKVAIAPVNDPLEKEADRVADAITRGQTPWASKLPFGEAPAQASPPVQRQESERPRDQPSAFPVQEASRQGQAKEDELKEKLKKGGLKAAGELGTFLWDQFSNSAEGERILAANERDWTPILKFFEDFGATIFGKLVISGVVAGAAVGVFTGAQSAQDPPGPDSDRSPSTGGPVPRAPKDDQLFGLELKWDFVTTPTGATLKTPWLDSPKIPIGSKPSIPSAALPAAPVLFKGMPKIPRICTVKDPQGDQGEADSRSAFIFWWLQNNRQKAEQRLQELLAGSTLHAPPNYAPSVINPLFKREPAADTVADPHVIEAGLRAPGQPLDAETRAFMEPRFRHDFSRVRVHSGNDAALSARAVSALAYTVGHDIVFDSGRFAPGTHEGRRLLAHELTHVVQQSGTDGVRANRFGDGAASDSARPRTQRPTRLIQRKPDGIDSFIRDGDWHGAARAIALGDPDAIAARVSSMPSTYRRYLVEGARHGEGIWNSDLIVSAVYKISPRDAIIGSVRYFVWKHLWGNAGEYLCGLSNDDMRQVAIDLRLTILDLNVMADERLNASAACSSAVSR